MSIIITPYELLPLYYIPLILSSSQNLHAFRAYNWLLKFYAKTLFQLVSLDASYFNSFFQHSFWINRVYLSYVCQIVTNDLWLPFQCKQPTSYIIPNRIY